MVGIIWGLEWLAVGRIVTSLGVLEESVTDECDDGKRLMIVVSLIVE